MEVVLNKLGNQPELKSVEGLFDAIQKAKTILQNPLAQCHPFERRQKCIECFGIALASNRPKFSAIAFEGIQLILRDPNFASENGTPDGQTRAEQLLALLMGIPNWREAATTQCQALAILVQLISSTEIPLKLKEALNAIEICKQTFDTASEESTSVRPAARATVTQMLNCYVQNRLALAETGDSVEIGALMDVTALLSELVSRMGTGIEEAIDPERIGEMRGISRRKVTQIPQPLLLPLDALFGVLSALEPNQLERHLPLFNGLKSDLIPVIICHLHGSAKCSSGISMELGGITTKRIGSLLKRATSRQSADSAPPQFSTISPAGIALDGVESARSFYQVVHQLLRLFTPMALCHNKLPPSATTTTIDNEILFLLEELWRSALLGPPIPKRAEAIRLAKHISNNLISFSEILQLNSATGTNSFWLLLIECLEECSTGNEQKLAIDAIRSLNALFVAISQIISIENLPKDGEFYAKLAAMENEKGERIEENVEKNEEKANKLNSSLTFPQQPEPAVKIFLDGFMDQIQNWQNCETALELDAQMQEWSISVHSMMNGILKGNDGRKRRKKSETSTPEDSCEEEEEEKEEEKPGHGLSQIEMYSIVGMAILGVEMERRATEMEWRNGQKELAENKDEANLLEGINKEYRNTINAILRSIHDGQINDIPPSNLNKIAIFFAIDPTIQLGKMEAILLARWLRTLLHNCWGSIQQILSQFPISRKSGQSEEGKLATVEAIGSFIQLAIQIGMCTELEWAFEYIAENVCALEELREAAKKSGDDPKAARRFCGRADILAMQMLVENALGAMQIAPKVAKYVIRCVQFLWELERWHFKLAKSTIDAIYEPPSLHIPPTKSGQNSPIGQLIGSTLPNVGEFSTNELARLMDQFLASIERIFLDGPNFLPLDSFCALLSAMALASEDNLNYSNGMAPTESSAQLLQFLCKLLCSKEHSTLIVKLSIWSRVKEYFVQFASSPTIPAEINRRVVDGLQDVLNSLLYWEWGGPPPKQYQQRICRIQGWNAKMFDIFPKIMESADCPLETCHQIGQIQMTFLEQNAEIIATGWESFFASIKLILQKSVSPSKDSSTKIDESLVNLAIEILQKFLRIQKPTLLIVAFGPYLDALIHLIELMEMDGKEEQSIFALLEQSERILLEFLFGSVIPISALPMNFLEEEEVKLTIKWNEYWQKWGTKKNGKDGKKEDYLELLAELKTEIEAEEMAKQEEEWSSMRKWLERGEECGGQQFDGNNLEQPWTHLGVKTDRIVAQIVLKFMANLMEITLKCDKAKATKLAVNLAEMLAKISNEIAPNFGVFCLCSTIIAQFRHQIDSPLTNSAARSLKQLLGIICAHSAMAELIETKTTTGEEDERNVKRPTDEWQLWLMDKLLDLAVKCVAKGGILSLAGCSLLRRFCANATQSTLNNLLLPKCANAIWMACRYSLFPIRMLIAQFFINSTDFSGDLGQMKVSYRLGLDPSEAEERIENVQQLANQVFRLDGQILSHRGDNGRNKGKVENEDTADGSNENAAHFPAKFAYLFLFEGNGGSASGNGAKKLSMGLDELMDSLLCQQLLVQLAAEQLAIIVATKAGEEDAKAPLVGTLCATLVICEQFEMRPGLKSLLQKLTGLPSSANIWTLYLTAANALIKFWIGNELKGQRKHLKQILHLLAKIGGTQGKCQILDEQKERKGMKKTPSIRSNPFISQQLSQESQSTKNAEAAKVRILALGKLLKFVEIELLENVKQNEAKEFAHLLGQGIRKMIEGWKNEEENDNEKAKEMLKEIAKKLEEN